MILVLYYLILIEGGVAHGNQIILLEDILKIKQYLKIKRNLCPIY